MKSQYNNQRSNTNSNRNNSHHNGGNNGRGGYGNGQGQGRGNQQQQETTFFTLHTIAMGYINRVEMVQGKRRCRFSGGSILVLHRVLATIRKRSTSI